MWEHGKNMTNLILYINNKTAETPLGNIGVDWFADDSSVDSFILSNGGVGVADGEPLPTEEELNRSAVQLSAIADVTIPKYFLGDYSDDILREIKNAGNQDKRYAFCASFDGPTASEPQLEVWDNDDMESYADPCLGNGAPSASWVKGICTTTSSPGTNWVGTPLAGLGASNILLLNDGNGALSVAGELYFNLKVVIPSGYVTPAIHTPTMVVVYTTN